MHDFNHDLNEDDQPEPLAELPGFDDPDADAGAMDNDILDVLDF